MKKPRIAGIILAAGNSSRMGEPKALLKIGPSVFLETIFKHMEEAKVDPLITVLGNDFHNVYKSISKKRNILFLHNTYPEKGQLFSFQYALRHVPGDVLGCMMVLVDHPMVTFPTYLSLMNAGQNNPDKIIVPVYKGKRGHPVFWGRKYFEELAAAPLSQGARFVLQKNIDSVQELDVEDDGVIADIDTPDEYSSYLKRLDPFE